MATEHCYIIFFLAKLYIFSLAQFNVCVRVNTNGKRFDVLCCVCESAFDCWLCRLHLNVIDDQNYCLELFLSLSLHSCLVQLVAVIC